MESDRPAAHAPECPHCGRLDGKPAPYLRDVADVPGPGEPHLCGSCGKPFLVADPPAAISVGPHTIPRTIPRFYNHSAHEWTEERTFDEVDADFPFLAHSGSVTAIARTREGAVAMVERMLPRGR